MKVLVTGANGLLGSNVVSTLIQKGMRVKCFVRKSSDLRALDGINYESFTGNLGSSEDVDEAVRDCNVVIHCAAKTTQWPSALKHYMKENVETTKNLLSASRKSGVEKFIYVGTANSFGYSTNKEQRNEDSAFNFGNAASGYMMSKLLAQKEVLKLANEEGFHAFVVNPSFMIGPKDYKPSSGQIIVMAASSRILTVPPGGKSFVDVRDVATAIVNGIDLGKKGECYLLCGENLTFKEFFQKVHLELIKAPPSIYLPRWLLSGIGRLGSLLENTTGIGVPLNYPNACLLNHELYYSPAKAVKELQMPQTPLQITLKETISWFTEHEII